MSHERSGCGCLRVALDERGARDISRRRVALRRVGNGSERGASGASSRTSARRSGARPARWVFLCTDVSAEYGGAGGDFRHEAVIYEELARRGLSGFGQGVHSICAHYLVNHGTEEQKRRLLPRMASGELIGAIGMTEPAAGSDLQGLRTRAVRDGDSYVVNGSKIFITNGYLAELIALVVKTHAGRGREGHLHPDGGDQGSSGLPGGTHPRQDGTEVAGHGGAVLRERARARGQSAGRRRGAGVLSADGRSCPTSAP